MKAKLQWAFHNAVLWWLFCAAAFRGIDGAGNLFTGLVAVNAALALLGIGLFFLAAIMGDKEAVVKAATASNDFRKQLPPEELRIVLDVTLFVLLLWHGWAWTAVVMAIEFCASIFLVGVVRGLAEQGGESR